MALEPGKRYGYLRLVLTLAALALVPAAGTALAQADTAGRQTQQSGNQNADFDALFGDEAAAPAAEQSAETPAAAAPEPAAEQSAETAPATAPPVESAPLVPVAPEPVAATPQTPPLETGAQTTAKARPPSSSLIEEIIVTAGKREQNLREIPGSVAALSGDDLEGIKATGLGDYIKRVPGVVLVDRGVDGSAPVIRGITTNTSLVGGQFTQAPVGIYVDDEAIRLFKKTGAWFVPTISAGRYVADKAKDPAYYSPLVRPKAEAIGPLMQATFGRAYKAGVKIAFGTDAAVFPHGDNAKEFSYMVEAGMPPLEAIRAATLNAAELLGKADQLGRVAPGYLADLIAVKRDPLTDIAVLQKVAFVMKAGTVYKQP
ncbi:MAG: amidohydrolase family protein [Nevskiales bacterium]